MWKSKELEWIDIELTSFCNIECKGCFRVLSKHSEKIINKTFLDIDTIRKKFKKEMFPSIKIINFCGSVDEPISHPQFFDIVRHFSDWNCHINIATNGSLRTEKWWTELASVLPKDHRVTWGIDGSDEISEVYRKGSNFKKVEQNFRAFISAGGKAVWQFIVFEHNEHQLEEAKAKAELEGFKDFRKIISHRKDIKDVKPKQEEIDNAVEIPFIDCKYGNQKRIFVNHMGNVIPCCHLNSKMLEYSVTGITKDLFEEILGHNYKTEINLNNTTIDNAIQSKVWKDIISSWNTDNPVPRCNQVCKQMKRDKFIQEKLKR